MRKRISILLVVILLAGGLNLLAGHLETSFTDGPYLFWEDGQPVAYYIIEQGSRREVLARAADGNYYLPWAEEAAAAVRISSEFADYQTHYALPERFLVISDLHGNLNGTIELLLAAGIIDMQYNWIYDGWLIINGDLMDRGEDVTKLFWLLFSLYQQAEESGRGRVIPLLGNHENFYLRQKEPALEGKYALTSQILGKTGCELYSEESFLGKWLRSWQCVLILDRYLLVHGGIAPSLMEKYHSFEDLNRTLTRHFQKHSLPEEEAAFLLGNNGPFWYRGYFYEEQKWEKSDAAIIKNLLLSHNLEKIIVGHTTFPQISLLHNAQVIAIDAGLKYQKSGQALLFTDGQFFILHPDGEATALKAE